MLTSVSRALPLADQRRTTSSFKRPSAQHGLPDQPFASGDQNPEPCAPSGELGSLHASALVAFASNASRVAVPGTGIQQADSNTLFIARDKSARSSVLTRTVLARCRCTLFFQTEGAVRGGRSGGKERLIAQASDQHLRFTSKCIEMPSTNATNNTTALLSSRASCQQQ